MLAPELSALLLLLLGPLLLSPPGVGVDVDDADVVVLVKDDGGGGVRAGVAVAAASAAVAQAAAAASSAALMSETAVHDAARQKTAEARMAALAGPPQTQRASAGAQPAAEMAEETQDVYVCGGV